MNNGVRVWVGLGLLAMAGSCAGRNLPPEPDSYVAADAIGAERPTAAETQAAPPACSPAPATHNPCAISLARRIGEARADAKCGVSFN